MSCAHEFFKSTYHTQICFRCGCELPHFGDSPLFKNSSYEQRNMPFSVAYSRKKRFSTMLHNLFFACLSHLDNKIMEMFDVDKVKFKNIIIYILNSSECKHETLGGGGFFFQFIICTVNTHLSRALDLSE